MDAINLVKIYCLISKQDINITKRPRNPFCSMKILCGPTVAILTLVLQLVRFIQQKLANSEEYNYVGVLGLFSILKYRPI